MWKIILTIVFVNVTAAPNVALDFAPMNRFALKLLENTYAFQENIGSGKNIAISPLSVWSTFSLLAEGSAGDTYQEIVTVLQLPNDLRATQALHLAASNVLKSNNQDVILQGQAAMFSDCSLEIHQEFCQSALLYSTEVYSVDAKNTTKLSNDINYYICIATEGRIVNAVKPENLEDLRMILVDALYFKANWTHPFDPTQTKKESFYNTQGKVIGSVNMMYHKERHNLADLDQIGAQVLELNYGKNEEYSMLILLPFDGMPIKKLINNLATQPVKWMTDFRFEEDLPEVDIYVPRFKMSSQIDLIPPLQYSGIQSIFDAKKAQLPGVSASPLYVTSTVQNVELEVTEEGTTAASSTVVGLEDRLLGLRFEANREFVFMITERRSNLIIFAGVYVEPSVV